MPTPLISEDLRRRIVEFYESRADATYAMTAEVFGVGEATVSRLLRLKRETGDIVHPIRPTVRTHKIDREWLRVHVEAHPDARLTDRVEAFQRERGVQISPGGVWFALEALGYTHKKKRFMHSSETPSG